MIHGAATASRAALTVQLWRDSISPRVLAQQRAQGAKDGSEVGAAHLTGDAERRRDPISNRIAQRLLEYVERREERAGGPVFALEEPKGLAQRLGTPMPELTDSLRERHARSDGRDERIDSIGPRRPKCLLACCCATPKQEDRNVGRDASGNERGHGHGRDEKSCDSDEQCPCCARADQARHRCARYPRLVDELLQSTARSSPWRIT